VDCALKAHIAQCMVGPYISFNSLFLKAKSLEDKSHRFQTCK